MARQGRYRVSMKKNINIPRVVSKLTAVVIALWAGGTIINEVGNVMNGTCSPFYKGLSLIGWTVGSGYCTDTSGTDVNTITSTNGSGILAVVGIIGIASVVLEFVQFRL